MHEQPPSRDELAYTALTGGARPASGPARPGHLVSPGLSLAGGAVVLRLALAVLLAVLQS
ncbi:MAG TPA: hypothetical protein VM097_04735 [Mycobacteriales bacterium]|nr:hypothetical protein [Mycobacteriales bacterium]